MKQILLSIAILFSLQISAQDKLPIAPKANNQLLAVAEIPNTKKDMTFNYTNSDLIYDDWNNTGVRNAHGKTDINLKVELKDFSMPLKSKKVSSRYGKRGNRMHEGIDIACPIGDSIYSTWDGKVRIVGYDPKGYGNYIVIRHPNGLETLYGHLSKQLIKVNQEVKQGQLIGLSGSTGRSSGPHLHFETRLVGYAINPETFFSFKYQDVISDYVNIDKVYIRQ